MSIQTITRISPVNMWTNEVFSKLSSPEQFGNPYKIEVCNMTDPKTGVQYRMETAFILGNVGSTKQDINIALKCMQIPGLIPATDVNSLPNSINDNAAFYTLFVPKTVRNSALSSALRNETNKEPASKNTDENSSLKLRLNLKAIKETEVQKKVDESKKLLQPLLKYFLDNECLICGFIALYESEQCGVEHMATHIRQNSYTCECCNYPFRSAADLFGHKINRTKKKPYLCEVCSQKFKRNYFLTLHLQSCHASSLHSSNMESNNDSQQMCSSNMKDNSYSKKMCSSKIEGNNQLQQVCSSNLMASMYSQQAHSSNMNDNRQSQQAHSSNTKDNRYSQQPCSSNVKASQKARSSSVKKSQKAHTSDVKESQKVHSSNVKKSQKAHSHNVKKSQKAHSPNVKKSQKVHSSYGKSHMHCQQVPITTMTGNRHFQQVPTSSMKGKKYSQQAHSNSIKVNRHSQPVRPSKTKGKYSQQVHCSKTKSNKHSKQAQSSHMSHMHSHTNQPVRSSIACTVCGKKFQSMTSVMAHRRYHAGAERYKCLICHKRFSNSRILKYHEHSQIQDKRSNNQTYNTHYSSYPNLTEHTNYRVRKVLFSCTYCDKKFYLQSKLLEHKMLSHGI